MVLKGGNKVANRNMDREVEERHIEKKEDGSKVASTFIKYFTYIVIFFGFLWFLVNYVFPMFGGGA